MKLVNIFVALILFSVLGQNGIAANLELNTIVEARREKVVETHFGVAIKSPYKWMENLTDSELNNWVSQQNIITNWHLSGELKTELETEFQEIFTLSENGSMRAVEEELHLRNRNKFFKQMVRPGEISWSAESSSSGKYEVKMHSDSGGDLKIVTILDSESDKLLPDILKVKFARFMWEEDEKSFIYSSDRDGRLHGSKTIIRRHVLGTKQSEDITILEAADSVTWIGLFKVDEKYILSKGERDQSTLSIFDLQSGTSQTIFDPGKGDFSPINFANGLLYLKSDVNSPMGEVISLNILTGEQKLVMPARDFGMDAVFFFNDEIYVTFIEEVEHKLYKFSKIDATYHLVDVPDRGSLDLEVKDDKFTIRASSMDRPSRFYELNNGKVELSQPAQAAPFALKTEKIFYTAHNGKKIPIWIVYRADIEPKNMPVFLYGYGGFSVNMMPRFSSASLPWLKRGGAFAVVTLPGGAEYGRNWHDAGRLFNKGNVFDDFATAGKHLINIGYTSSEKMAIGGGSNGGLLVAATMNLYPTLFKAAVPEVGVMDLTRFQLLTSGKWWIHDYGDRNIKKEFKNQLKWSPIHNLKRREYPSTLVMTADQDDRVHSSHSYRYAAKLMHQQTGQNPILLHTTISGSHGGGYTSTQSELIRHLSNKWAFVIRELGVQ